ncbi:MAG TPA: hypothetical protein VNO55_29100 [Polyangia bacterium]|nr:hypothetical protein [Polyangia bacterium]
MKRVAVEWGLGLLIGLGWLGAGCDSNSTIIAADRDAAANSDVAPTADAVAEVEPDSDGPVEAADDLDTAPDLDADVAPDLDAISEDRSPPETTDLPLTDKRKVDILFVVDNSPSMRPLQEKLSAAFPAFVDILQALPHGLPDVHVGVVSSDLGAGPTAPSPQCRVGGDQGQLQSQPRRQQCPMVLNASDHFLASAANVQNFTGDLASAFSCIASLGDQGCGFEHQFASMLRALEPATLPATNRQFLRDDALLAIVMLTNEDDCSAPPDSGLFDPSSQLVSDPLGPLASYRCNEFGHLCGGQPPPRSLPAGQSQVDLGQSCTSAEDGRLLRVADVIARTKALKRDPSQIVVAAIAGPVTPYIVKVTPGTTSTGVTENQPVIAHSCVAADASYADPAVRIRQWTGAFGAKGLFLPICADSLAPTLQQIADAIESNLLP